MLTDDQKSFLNGYLAQARIAVVVTQSPSGYAQITPNWFNWDGKRLSVSTTKERLKYKNLSRNPKLSVLSYEEPMAANYVTLRGEVEIQDDDGIWTPTRAILGRHLDADKADAYIERMKSTEQRVLLWLAPEQMTVRYP